MDSKDPWIDAIQVGISASGVAEIPGTVITVANILLNKAPRAVLSLIDHEKYNNGKTPKETLTDLAIEVASLLPYVEIGLKGPNVAFKTIGKTKDIFKVSKYWNKFVDIAHLTSELDNIFGAIDVFKRELPLGTFNKQISQIGGFTNVLPYTTPLSSIPEIKNGYDLIFSKKLQPRSESKKKVQYFSSHVDGTTDASLRRNKNETNTKSNTQKQRVHDRETIHKR